MPSIDVSQAQAGMVLSEDVLDKRGRILIPAGKELVEKYLTALPAWGVTRIDVEGDESTDTEAPIEAWALDRATAEIDELFAKSNRQHPALQRLIDACVGRRARSLADRGADAP